MTRTTGGVIRPVLIEVGEVCGVVLSLEEDEGLDVGVGVLPALFDEELFPCPLPEVDGGLVCGLVDGGVDLLVGGVVTC